MAEAEADRIFIDEKLGRLLFTHHDCNDWLQTACFNRNHSDFEEQNSWHPMAVRVGSFQGNRSCGR